MSWGLHETEYPTAHEHKTLAAQRAAERVCTQRGHDDVTRTRPKKAAPMVQCLRCGRVGWRVPA